MKYSEEEIIEGCKKGSKKAQKLLYDLYSRKYYGICLRYFKNSNEAEDALQEGFIRIFNSIDKFRFEGSFEGWMRRIIVNTTLNFYKANLKHYYNSDFEELEEIIEDENTNYDKLTVDLMLKTIRELPDGYRLVFNLFEIEGYSHKEIAEMLGISINTSKSQLMKAKKLLQKKLTNVQFIK